jgi:hypothetical protein
MRGDDDLQEGMFSYISPEKRVPADHPLRSRLACTNFYACFSRGRIRLHADVIVNRIAKTLLAAQVSFMCCST